MNFCLWCDVEIIYQVHWKTLLNGNRKGRLCHECFQRISFINGEVCTKCCRESKLPICHDCKRWQLFFNGEDPLLTNIATFKYNDFMKEVIAKWKYRGDFILIDMFTKQIQKTIQTGMNSFFDNSILVPIPLSKERLEERGFNQSLAIAERITDDARKINNIIERIHSEKQSKKSRSQRIFRKNPFKLLKKTNKTVILVDDIYTTGTTLRHAAKLLKQSGCPAVYSYSLIRG